MDGVKGGWKGVGTLWGSVSFALVVCVFGLCAPSWAAMGDLDTSFGTGGKVTTDFGSGSDIGYSVAVVQPDGKILVAGQADNGSNIDFALARYNSDGTLDTSFGTGGLVTTAFGHGANYAFSLALDGDDKILVAGQAYTGSSIDFALARYESDGNLDTTFGGDGKVTTAFGSGTDIGKCVLVDADGKILVVGLSNTGVNYDFALARYDSDGELDTTFGGGDGKVTTDFGSRNDCGYSVALDADGKILVGGYASIGSSLDFALARYESDGDLDTTFGGDGKVTTDFGHGYNVGFSVAVDGDGKILVAGRATTGSSDDFALARYNTDGSLDTSFDSDGLVTTDFDQGYDKAYAVVVQSDGKILAAGQAYIAFSSDDFALARYNGDGSLDPAFGSRGLVTTDFNSPDDCGYSVAIDDDDKILVAGYASNGSDTDFALARYLGVSATPSPEVPAVSWRGLPGFALLLAWVGIMILRRKTP